MAFTASSKGSPSVDQRRRSSWTIQDVGQDALAALETYKQKDASKGEYFIVMSDDPFAYHDALSYLTFCNVVGENFVVNE